MRRSTLWTLAGGVAVIVMAACGVEAPRQYGEEKPQPYVSVTAFDGDFTAKLGDTGPMAQVKKQAVSGDPDPSQALRIIDAAWRQYVNQTHDGRLGQHPVPIKGLELDTGQAYADVCWEATNHRFPQVQFPVNCVDPKSGGERKALAVWPQGYTAKVQEFAAATSEREGWILASLVAGLSYADHIRVEMRDLRFAWPDGRAFDYCVAGMSLRAVFPANAKELTDTNALGILDALDQLVSPPEDPLMRPKALATGYAEGRLDACLP